MIHLLNNRNFIIILAFVLGLIFSDLAHYTKDLTIPVIALVLTVSIAQVSISDFFPLKNLMRPFILGMVFNFLVLGLLTLVLAWILLPDEIWIGYAIIAATPPGAAVIPFTHVRNGDVTFSLMGTFTVYLAALFITPALLFLFTGGVLVSPFNLFMTMVQVILIPFIISQILVKIGLKHYIDKYRPPVIKWGFFVIIFSVIGLNRDVFFTNPAILFRMALISILTTFVLSLIVKFAARKTGFVSKMEAESLMLLSTIKNMGFASAIALAFFAEIASMPAAVTAAVYAFYFIFLGVTASKKKLVAK